MMAALIGTILALSLGGISLPAPAQVPAGEYPTVALTSRPAGFWRSAGEALAIARRQPATRRLLAQHPHLRVAVFPGMGGQRAVGVWSVHYFVPGTARRPGSVLPHGVAGQDVLIADRSGTVLEDNSWAWSVPWLMGDRYPTWIRW